MVTLSPIGMWYSNSGGTSLISNNQLAINSGSSSTSSFYFKSTVLGPVSLSASGGGYTLASASLTVTGTGNFGYNTIGSGTSNIENIVVGSQFTTPTYAVTAKYYCIHYYIFHSHCKRCNLHGKWSFSRFLYPSFSNYIKRWLGNFHMTSPTALTANTNYILVVWANNPSGSATVSNNNASGDSRSSSQTYGTWPNSVTFTTGNYENNIYCTYAHPNVFFITFLCRSLRIHYP